MSTAADLIQPVSFQYPGERWRKLNAKAPAEAKTELIPVFDRDNPDCRVKIYDISVNFSFGPVYSDTCQIAWTQDSTVTRTLYGYVDVAIQTLNITSPSECTGRTYKRYTFSGLNSRGGTLSYHVNTGRWDRAEASSSYTITPREPDSGCYTDECRFSVTSDGVEIFSKVDEVCPVYVVGQTECPPGYLHCVGCCYSCSDAASKLQELIGEVKALDEKYIYRP